MMVTPRLSTRNKTMFYLVTIFFIWAFGLNSVRCDLFCPPAVENANYSIVAETYNLTSWDLSGLIATWYFGYNVLATCNFTTLSCISKASFPSSEFSFQVLLFGDHDVQMTITITNFSIYLEQNYSIHWNISGTSAFETCQVIIGNPIDECVTQRPCVNATGCTDQLVGYECKCKLGYSGKNCREGDFRLYCSHSVLILLFSQQADGCGDMDVSCYVAGVNSYTDIGLSYSEISNNGSSVLTVQPQVADDVIFFKVCIHASTPKGIYEILYQLQSTTAKSSYQVRILPQIEGINTAPAFNTPGSGDPYVIRVLENTAQSTIITYVNKSTSWNCKGEYGCIEVFDPDVSGSNGIDSLSLTVSPESQQPVPITFQSSRSSDHLGYFFLSGQLTPSMNISFNMTVTDGENGTASAKVIFTVADVNHPPKCMPDAIYVDLDIRAQPVTYVDTVSCTVDDTDITFRQISYSITGQYSRFFNVSTDGIITMYKAVMELEPGLHSFNVTATGYSVSPDSAYVFYVPVYVNLTAPQPICNLTVAKLPQHWEVNASAELKLECDVSGVDKLEVLGRVDVTLNNSSIFDIWYTKESSTMYKIILHVRQYEPAAYNFEVLATLGGEGSAASVMLKMYNPPKFNTSVYIVTMADSVPVGTTVLNLTATTDIPNANLTYTLKSGDDESLFTLDNGGFLSLAKNLQSVAGSDLHLVFEVQDSVSGLNAMARATISVVDTNEPPVCNLSGSVTVNSSLPPDSIITTIRCYDPDKTPEYNGLVYNISSVPSAVQLGIRDNGDIFLLQALPAGITSFSVLVIASDISLSTSVHFTIVVVVIKCPAETTEFGLYFPETPVNSVLTINCTAIYSGTVSRSCNLNQTWGPFNYNNCRRKDLEQASTLIDQLRANTSHSPEEVEYQLKMIANYTAGSLRNSSTILSGDIKQIVEILSGTGAITKLYETAILDGETLKSFASSADSIINADGNMWKEALIDDEEEGAMLLDAMDIITVSSLREENLDDLPFVKENLALKRARSQDDIVFPSSEDAGYQNYGGWVLQSKSTAFLSKKAFNNVQDEVKYSVILYKNVTEKFKINQNHQNGSLKGKVLNSDILCFSINVSVASLSSPLMLNFSVLQTNYSDPACGYLDTSASVAGVWSSRGCTSKVLGDKIQCSCNHLTNFAVLMSPYGNANKEDEKVLGIISAVGCGISILCLAITILVYLIIWKYVKGDRSVLHINLSVCLIAAYIVFLVGVDRTDSTTGCKVVAALLHYLFLVVFFIMLSEGIEVFKSVSFVFSSDSIICQLISFSYGVPAIIVAVSLGVTQTEGYGNDITCWLSTKGGLIWAFVGPALLVILINFIIIVQVLIIMQRTKTMMVKSAQMRTKSVVRTICVLSPLLGVTWVFGVLSVNENTIVFQYLFAIFNSLQGLFIFICYCLLTPQVRDGFRALRRKHRARSFDSSQRVVSSSYSGKYSESDTNFAKHKKKSQTSNSSYNTRTTSLRNTSKQASTDSISEEHSHHYERRNSDDFDNGHFQEHAYAYHHHPRTASGYGIPLASSDPGRRNTVPALHEMSESYPGGFPSNWNNPGKGLTNHGYHGSLFSTTGKNTDFC